MQVIRPDLPGSGRSPTSARLSLEDFADAVAKAVTALGIGRANFAGHSMGTIVCFHIALRNPKLVKSMALLGPLLAPADAGRQGLRERAAAARARACSRSPTPSSRPRPRPRPGANSRLQLP